MLLEKGQIGSKGLSIDTVTATATWEDGANMSTSESARQVGEHIVKVLAAKYSIFLLLKGHSKQAYNKCAAIVAR